VLLFDAIRVKVRDQRAIADEAVYLTLDPTPDGRKHGFGLWIDANEGVKFWLRIVNELRNRGVTLRTAIRSRGHFLNDEAAIKLLYLISQGREELENAQREWVLPHFTCCRYDIMRYAGRGHEEAESQLDHTWFVLSS
jgi:transposase-like protein